ncbi:hypothetical protein PHYBLDRAFT_145477 [Phycomyces blakesleeanus NRRL 1555(-)]|uniref:Uncharacterized protein n=1 Tax=Phycomyces blakesleeanus (strain ATCC 8743b / DSM 1359 / FGSC 10004 / NBRC 33097 / NRRL 1555) TaxID=763407 RepID=A0A167MUE2_PHYB8|nr:hypothetical protein PHYBLDRAFT_145477 [Phycomyces blakesleeanus NRRL 1555(-)]OAD74014.1 hypothetical protein PHYBLDRAFT_145477 [Phycomyces blakesleeanus NRRL 1555(-)]|eukprot:XP_018292054.1 hypothetical protein PHYBLDRAFT_145477 [Phycomyces blakesleeanus NRRL 1555(-)]
MPRSFTGRDVLQRRVRFTKDVQMPDSLHDLSKLVMDISNLLLVPDTFDRACIHSADSPPPRTTSPDYHQLHLGPVDFIIPKS